MTETLSQRAYAARRGVTVQYINKLVKAGRLPLVEGKVDVNAADKILDERQAKAKPAKAKKAKGLDGVHERARLAKEKADAQAIENAKARGELVPQEEVATNWDKLVTACKTRLLAIPNKAAPQVVGMDPKEASGFIRGLIVEALEELASGDVAELEDGPDFLPGRGSA
jgi:phage terminase Nu1 subunit (DNA packaging protein)